MIANSSLFTNLGFLTLTKYLGSQPFMNMTVHDYLWGYNDSLIKVANRVVASWIPFEKLGLMDRVRIYEIYNYSNHKREVTLNKINLSIFSRCMMKEKI